MIKFLQEIEREFLLNHFTAFSIQPVVIAPS